MCVLKTFPFSSSNFTPHIETHSSNKMVDARNIRVCEGKMEEKKRKNIKATFTRFQMG